MIYNNYFGFNEEPFGVTPDPKFLFMSKCHEDAMAHVMYGIDQHRGFVMLTGEAGSGKTTLMRHILQGLDPDIRTAMILNPKMSELELMKFINHDFGLKLKRSATYKSLMDDLNGFLLQCHQFGGKAVLAIDEAQELSPECLEFVRLLSNLETDTRKLLQVVLLGQPELREIINQPRLRQLNQRIAVRYHLGPLKPDETARYLHHRLHRAGSLALSFPEKSAKLIHRFSGGIPRLINISADRTLMKTYGEGITSIKTPTVKSAIHELRQMEAGGRSPGISTKVLWIMLSLLLLAAAAGIVLYDSPVVQKILGAFG